VSLFIAGTGEIPVFGVPGALQVFGGRGAAGSAGWWDANATIPAGNVLEYVELPTQGQAYVGAGVAAGQPWTIAVRTNYAPFAGSNYVFDSEVGRVVFGYGHPNNGFYTTDSGWIDLSLFTSGDKTYFLIFDGTDVQAYRSASAVGSSSTSDEGLGSTTRWRDVYDLVGDADWPADLPVAAVYDIALSSAQRSALDTSMMAE